MKRRQFIAGLAGAVAAAGGAGAVFAGLLPRPPVPYGRGVLIITASRSPFQCKSWQANALKSGQLRNPACR
jgi:hypothetical protein